MLRLFAFVSLIYTVGSTTQDVRYAAPRSDRVVPDTTLVVPAGSMIVTELGRGVSLRSISSGDTLYLRVDSAVAVAGRTVIRAGTFLELSLGNTVAPSSQGDRQLALRMRLSRLVPADGSIADLFAVDVGGRTPNGRQDKRWVEVEARVDLSSGAAIIPAGSIVRIVPETPFTIAMTRPLGGAVPGDVRFSGSPPHRKCYVAGSPATPDVVVGGVPGTPAVGAFPGTPATPDLTLPGAPARRGHWEGC